jgi:hypothetical protein
LTLSASLPETSGLAMPRTTGPNGAHFKACIGIRYNIITTGNAPKIVPPSGLPDGGIFSNQKSQFGKIYQSIT